MECRRLDDRGTEDVRGVVGRERSKGWRRQAVRKAFAAICANAFHGQGRGRHADKAPAGFAVAKGNPDGGGVPPQDLGCWALSSDGCEREAAQSAIIIGRTLYSGGLY